MDCFVSQSALLSNVGAGAVMLELDSSQSLPGQRFAITCCCWTLCDFSNVLLCNERILINLSECKDCTDENDRANHKQKSTLYCHSIQNEGESKIFLHCQVSFNMITFELEFLFSVFQRPSGLQWKQHQECHPRNCRQHQCHTREDTWYVEMHVSRQDKVVSS